MARTLSPGTAVKLAKVRAMIAALPVAERTYWEDAVGKAVAPITVAGSHIDFVPMPLDQATAQADVEWDLALANWLDKVYAAVSDRVADVAIATKEAAKRTAREIASEATGSIGKATGLIVLGGVLALGAAWKLTR
jgi:hypothetical protein